MHLVLIVLLTICLIGAIFMAFSIVMGFSSNQKYGLRLVVQAIVGAIVGLVIGYFWVNDGRFHPAPALITFGLIALQPAFATDELKKFVKADTK